MTALFIYISALKCDRYIYQVIRGLMSVTDIAVLCSRWVAVITDIALIGVKSLEKESYAQIYKLD